MTPTTRRVLQAVLHEVGAIAMVGPVLGLAFFFVYAMGCTWAFDKVFGLPQSALRPR